MATSESLLYVLDRGGETSYTTGTLHPVQKCALLYSMLVLFYGRS